MIVLPKTMKALRYSAPKEYAVVDVPLPKLRENDVLVKVKACGVCGTDLHIHDGEFIAEFPLIPGHETVGHVVALGAKAQNKDFHIGDYVCADNSELCGECFYCRRGEELFCENFKAHGVAGLDGGFAEFVAYPLKKVFKLQHISPVNATLIEPTSCALHGLSRISAPPSSSILVLGAGATGLMLAQLLRLNGAAHLTLAAPGGLKMTTARKLDVADTYVELDRGDSSPQFEAIKKANPYGFDVVVEATGAVSVLEEAMEFVRRGGKLCAYGVYRKGSRVGWSPEKIFRDEITVLSSFSEMYEFPNAIAYLDHPSNSSSSFSTASPLPPSPCQALQSPHSSFDSWLSSLGETRPRTQTQAQAQVLGKGKVGGREVQTQGIVNMTFTIEEWGECLEAIRGKRAVKAAIVF